MAIQKIALKKDHPDYATTLNNIGATYDKVGRYEEALKLYYECLAIRKSVLKEDHPEYATTLNNIGITYLKMG